MPPPLFASATCRTFRPGRWWPKLTRFVQNQLIIVDGTGVARLARPIRGLDARARVATGSVVASGAARTAILGN
jgi:hypothetical protein